MAPSDGSNSEGTIDVPVESKLTRRDDGLLVAVGMELENARHNFDDIASLHEGYAVILEELDEFWELVKAKRSERSDTNLRAELIQVAAMAIRTASDVDDVA